MKVRRSGERRGTAARRPRATAADHQRRELQHYVELFDFAPVGYVLLDSVGLIINANIAGCRLLGVERRYALGRPLTSFVIPEDRGEVREHLRRCRVRRRVVESEVRMPSAGRKLVTCRLHSKRGTDESREVIPTIIVDQSEHLALDEARLAAERRREAAERDAQFAKAASAMRDRFLAVVSHELRTPLTPALFAASRLAAWTGLTDDAKKLAVAIKRNIEFEAHLIDDLLDLARISENRLDLQLETLDVHEVIDEAVATCRPYAQQNGVTVQVHLAAAAHHATADRTRLRQVFWNLLNNAVKFSEGGSRVVVGSANPSEHAIRVSVRDEGIGMEPRVLQSLFAPFEPKPIHHGSRAGLGLGLAISKGIIASHGGVISAASDGPGRGATVAVELETVAPAPRHANRFETKPNLPALETLRVLIIEDDKDSRDMLALFLASEGCEVGVASTLADGLRQLHQRWDVVVSDLGLPDGSGLDVARHALRMPRPPTRLIALTGYGSSEDVKATRAAGFHAHVVKPIDLDQMLATLGGDTSALAVRRGRALSRTNE